MPTLLIVTVGGSPEPIIQSITDYQPDFVVFVTSAITATNKTSSTTQVTTDILPAVSDYTHTHSVVSVDPDNLMDVYAKCRAVVMQYINTHSVIADYTGGTKSMSAGLVLVMRQYPNVSLSLVAGVRKALANEYKAPVSSVMQPMALLHVERRLQHIATLFDMFEYQAAAASAQQFLRIAGLNQQRAWWQTLHHLLNGYAFWDNFEHEKALDTLQPYLPSLDKARWSALLAVNNKGKVTEYELVHDLLANASRRAIQKRYDDATARVYRALEALAQIRLRTTYNVDTAKVPQEVITRYAKGEIPAKFAQVDHVEAGMFNAYELLMLFGDAVGPCWQTHQRVILNSIQARNNSILAHGFQPVSQRDYESFRQSVDAFVGAITTAGVRIGDMPPSLPTFAELQAQLPQLPDAI